jgi:hypothetical protein
VKGFDTAADEDSIREGLTSAFGEFGKVADVRLPFDRDNQCLKGFGYIVFADADGAAVSSLSALLSFLVDFLLCTLSVVCMHAHAHLARACALCTLRRFLTHRSKSLAVEEARLAADFQKYA